MTPQPNRPATALAPDATAIEQFLTEVVKSDIHLAAITPDGPLDGSWFGADTAAATAWAVAKNREGAGVYWTANAPAPHVGSKPGKGDITAARFAHVDIDPPKGGGALNRALVRQQLDSFPVKPTVIIDSGNGFQALWKLDRPPEDFVAIEGLNKALARQLGGDNCHNIDRLLRLPGTVNYPNQRKAALGRVAVMASLTYAGDGPGHPFATLWAAFPSDARPASPSAVGAQAAAASQRSVTLLRSSDLTKGDVQKLKLMIDSPHTFFRTSDRSSWAHGIAAEMVGDGYDEGQVLGVLLNPANAGAAHVGDQHDPRRAAQRAWQSARKTCLSGGKIFNLATRTAKVAAHTARPYEELLAAAECIGKADADGIAALAEEAAVLEDIHRETVLKALKRQTGLGLGTLRQQTRSGSATEKPDHLALARAAIEEIGPDNIVFAGDSLWSWSITGVWKRQDDRVIKQRIQRACPSQGVNVTGALVNGVLDVFKSEVHSPDHRFNRGDPEAVNCLNGQLELLDGVWTLAPHRREDFRTTQVPITYDQAAEAPRFLAFLDEAFRDDTDKTAKAQTLLELMGYTLMAHARHEKFVILVGPGANGKSVLLSVLSALCGSDNISAVQPSSFNRSFDRAHLDQKLANIISELKQGEVIADAELKAITSGEPSTVDHKFGHPFVMHPFATCWFGTNHMPHTRDFSDALFRRAVILPFNRTFAGHEQDPMLASKLKGELPGILNLALDAYARALKAGFTEPESSRAAKLEWRLEADQVAQFVDGRCDRDSLAEIGIGDLYHAYTAWAASEGIIKPVAKKGLRDRLTRLGFGERRTSDVRYVTGLRLKPPSWKKSATTQKVGDDG